MAEQPRRVSEVGVVTSTKMQKTIKVLVERRRQHPRYKKYLRLHTTYLAHDEQEAAREGDWVEIIQTRPLSKCKRWRLLRVFAGPGAARSSMAGNSTAEAEEPVAPSEASVNQPSRSDQASEQE